MIKPFEYFSDEMPVAEFYNHVGQTRCSNDYILRVTVTGPMDGEIIARFGGVWDDLGTFSAAYKRIDVWLFRNGSRELNGYDVFRDRHDSAQRLFYAMPSQIPIENYRPYFFDTHSVRLKRMLLSI